MPLSNKKSKKNYKSLRRKLYRFSRKFNQNLCKFLLKVREYFNRHKYIPKGCNTCKHKDKAITSSPCRYCLDAVVGYPKWEYNGGSNEKQ